VVFVKTCSYITAQTAYCIALVIVMEMVINFEILIVMVAVMLTIAAVAVV
jgi:hypothetical protein